MTQKTFKEELSEIFQQAEDVGEDTANKLAETVSRRTNSIDEAMEAIYEDERFQQDINDIRGVGEETLKNVVNLAGAIVDGSYTIIRDSVDALRVAKDDYVRSSSGDNKETAKEVDDPAHMN